MPPREKPSDTFALRADAATRNIVDISDGIDRIMGNRELYQRMLVRFRSDYQQGAAPIRSALADGDRTLAHRLAHTIKGAAGMIGAHQLHGQASRLEMAIRIGHDTQPQELDDLGEALDAVLEVLDGLLDAGAQQHATRQVVPRPLLADPALLTRLVELLVSGDGAAIDLLEESGTSLKVVLGEARLERVAQAVNDFDFEGALLALRQMPGDALGA